ncbi:MAG: phytoene/squalene synthase family protein [Pseudomonadales bacterium]|nr:phytoene/squalene synthase family protein [Pseudomonadales bacterium]
MSDSKQEVVQAILRENGRTFWLASFFLPKASAEKATDLYAFCRIADDLADDYQAGNEEKLESLRLFFRRESDCLTLFEEWQQFLFNRVRSNTRALNACVALIEGIQSDLSEAHFTQDRELLRYSYAVAGTVGIIMAELMQSRSEVATYHAIDLGIAMQLTNISRDVLEDAKRGRRYIPCEVPVESIARSKCTDTVKASIVSVITLSNRYYRSGLAGLPYLPRIVRPCIYIMGRIYSEIGNEILRRGVDWSGHRAVVSPLRKTRIILSSLPYCFWLLLKSYPSSSRLVHEQSLHTELGQLPGVHQ